MRQRVTVAVLACALVLIIGTSALLTAGLRSTTDWHRLRPIVFESDDWGLPGFIPEAGAWEGIDRESLMPGHFPRVYWESTLEDSSQIGDLVALLSNYRDRDGLPPVFQTNYIVSSLGWSEEDAWSRFDLPALPPEYDRPGLWTAVAEGIARGVWYPEFHGVWHYDPRLRRESGLEDGPARQATQRGILVFPRSENARELAPWRGLDELSGELDGGLGIFHSLFGRFPGSTAAPDYTWNARVERLWSSRGIRVIQAKREQRNPDYGWGWQGRLRKLFERAWVRLNQPERLYLERNVRFEPVQTGQAAEAVQTCVGATLKAWRHHRPAIVETHRINYVHTDPALVVFGRQALQDYLERLLADPSTVPTVLTDVELAQLSWRGVSWCRRGDLLILRNTTHARRILSLPPAAGFPGDEMPDCPSSRLLLLEPHSTHILTANPTK